jgi:hypothetical protein
MADISNLPEYQKYEIGRGTSDNPQLTLFTGPALTVPCPTTGIVLTFLVTRTLMNDAADVDPVTDPNVLMYKVTGMGITVVDESNGVAEVNITELDTYDPNDITVAAKYETDQPYPFLALANNGSGQNRVLARGLFYVRDVG